MTNIRIEESEKVEFKESLAELDQAGETIAAFANKVGGDLYLGIRSSGEIVGIGIVNDSTLLKVTQKLADNFDPQLIFNVEKVILENKECILIKVAKSSGPHHFIYKGKPYIRIGNTTKIMEQAEYKKRLIQSSTVNPDFTSHILEDATIDDLSSAAIDEVRKLLIQSGRYDVDISALSNEQLLKDLLLIRNDKITIAAIILLGTNEGVSKYLSYSEVRYGYKTNESEIRNLDTVIFKEGYFLFYNNLWEKIQSRNVTLSIPFDFRLVEKKTFDELSIREAINNAITHRDYSVQASVIVMQYQTKLVVKSPGGLPEGVTVENIMDETRPRNKLLADLLFKCELVEEFGNGVNLMFRNQLSLGKSPPNFSRTTDISVELELDGSIQDEEFAKYVLRIANQKNKDLNDEELILLNKIKSGIDVELTPIIIELENLGLIEKSGYNKYMLSKQYYVDTNQEAVYTRTKGVNWTSQKNLILEHLSHFKKATKKELEVLFQYQVQPSHVSNLLADLKKNGKVVFLGKPRSQNGFWVLAEDKNE